MRVKDVLYAVVKAMEYLHSKLGDLRPRTVGFDAEGKVLIANFCRARDMDVVRGIGKQLATRPHHQQPRRVTTLETTRRPLIQMIIDHTLDIIVRSVVDGLWTDPETTHRSGPFETRYHPLAKSLE